MKRSATSNHGDTSVVVPFKEAVRAVGVAWRRKHKYEPVPALSHALSTSKENAWTVVDAELGEVVAVAHNRWTQQASEPAGMRVWCWSVENLWNLSLGGQQSAVLFAETFGRSLDGLDGIFIVWDEDNMPLHSIITQSLLILD